MAPDLDLALEPATDEPEACNRMAGARRNAAKKPPAHLRPAHVSSDGFDESDRSLPGRPSAGQPGIVVGFRDVNQDKIRRGIAAIGDLVRQG